MSKTPKTREERLQRLISKITLTPALRKHARPHTHLVVGDGSARPKILFLNDGPDAEDEVSGKVLSDPKDSIFRGILKEMADADPFVLNAVFWRTVGASNEDNRSPNLEELKLCRPHVDALISLLSPQLIIVLGAVPLNSLFRIQEVNGEYTTKDGVLRVSEHYGRFKRYQGIPVLCTYNPQYFHHVPAKEQQTRKYAYWQDMLKARRFLGLPVSERQARFFDHTKPVITPALTLLSTANAAQLMGEKAASALQQAAAGDNTQEVRAELTHILSCLLQQDINAVTELCQLRLKLGALELTDLQLPTWLHRKLVRMGFTTPLQIATTNLESHKGLGPAARQLILQAFKTKDILYLPSNLPPHLERLRSVLPNLL